MNGTNRRILRVVTIAAVAVASVSAASNQYVAISSTGILYGSGPGEAYPGTNPLRFEGRISDVNIPAGASAKFIGFANSIGCRESRGTFLCEFYPDTAFVDGAAVGLDLQGRTDFVFRVQRDTALSQISLEMWDASGGNYKVSAKQLRSMTSPLRLGTLEVGRPGYAAAGLSGHFHFLRVFSSTVPVGKSFPDVTNVRGDLMNYEFDGDLSDSSGNKRHLSVVGSTSWGESPGYPPSCSAGQSEIFRAGRRAHLDGSQAIALNGRSASYSWQQLSGPSVLQFSSHNDKSPEIGGIVAGEYYFQLTITDSEGRHAECIVRHAAVPTDDNDNIIIPNPEHARILGYLTRFGSNPWPWYDERQKAYLDWLVGAIDTRFKPYWDDPGPGTITVTHGSPFVIGNGTTFQTTFCGGPGNTKPLPTASILIWYPSLMYPGTFGRRSWPLVRCDSDTKLTLGRSEQEPWAYTTTALVGAGENLNYTFNNESLYGVFGFGSAPANYYDNVMALYAMYYRTGLEDYLTAARKLADRWWTFMPIDRGGPYDGNSGYWQFAEPRSVSLTGLIMRAVDGRPEMWTGIKVILDLYTRAMTSREPVGDLRNAGYQMMWTSMAAMFDTDSERRGVYLRRVAEAMKNKWIPLRQPDGSWLMGPWGWYNFGSPHAAPYRGKASVENGRMTVSGVDTNFVTGASSDGCTVGNYIWFAPPEAVSWYSPTGGLNGDPTAYRISSVQSENSLNIDRAYEGESGFKNYGCGSWVGVGVQPFMLALTGQGQRWAYLALSQSADQEHHALAEQARQGAIGVGAWLRTKGTVPSSMGVYYGRIIPVCEAVPRAASCTNNDDPEGQRINTAESFFGMVQEYILAPSEELKAELDDRMSILFGKPGSGAVKEDSRYLVPLEGYMFNTSNPLYMPKWLGFFYGVGATWAWPSVRTGGVAPETLREVQVSYRLSDVPSATQARIRIRRPDGSETTFPCEATRCAAMVDVRQGEHRMQIQYLLPSGQVASESVEEVLPVPR